MLSFQGSSRLKDLSIAVILAAIFSQFGFLILLYTVPLYSLYYRRGLNDLLLGAGSVMLLILIFTVWKIRAVADTDFKGALILIEMIIPVLLMLGMFFVIDIIPVVSGYRRLYRLFFATVAAVLICVPVFMILRGNEVFIEAVSGQINLFAGAAFGEGSGTYDSEVVKTYLGENGILGYMKSFYMKSAAAIYFLILLIASRISEMILCRLEKRQALKLINFNVSSLLLWPMLLAAVGMLVDIFELFNLGFVSAVVWNVGLVLMFVYGLQGLAIMRSLFLRFKLPQSFRLMFEFIILLMLVMPGINYIVIIGLPVFGISETWINLRKSIRST